MAWRRSFQSVARKEFIKLGMTSSPCGWTQGCCSVELVFYVFFILVTCFSGQPRSKRPITSIGQTVNQSVCSCLSGCLAVIYLPVSVCLCLSICLPFCLAICTFRLACLPACLPTCLTLTVHHFLTWTNRSCDPDFPFRLDSLWANSKYYYQ